MIMFSILANISLGHDIVVWRRITEEILGYERLRIFRIGFVGLGLYLVWAGSS
jgi:hypothetical protein